MCRVSLVGGSSSFLGSSRLPFISRCRSGLRSFEDVPLIAEKLGQLLQGWNFRLDCFKDLIAGGEFSRT